MSNNMTTDQEKLIRYEEWRQRKDNGRMRMDLEEYRSWLNLTPSQRVELYLQETK